MNYEVKCCPRCGEVKFGAERELSNCETCGHIKIDTQVIVDGNKFFAIGTPDWENQRNQLFESARQQYTINSPQFDQAAWDRRVGIENGTIKVPEKPEPKPVPKCPTCGSTDVHRISALNRGASVAMWGLFSGKIGKNYECENCKARW